MIVFPVAKHAMNVMEQILWSVLPVTVYQLFMFQLVYQIIIK